MTTVLVTGASGFIAKHIVRELLDNGYVVRPSTRSNHRRDELDALFPDAGLEHVTLDLNHDEGWADALADVDVLRRVSRPLIHSSNLASEQPESPNAIYWHRCASRSAAS